MRLPPTPLRRVVLAPLMCVLTVGMLVFSPLLLIAAAFAVRWLPGRWRGLRLLWVLVVYMVRETVGLIALFLLWVASGFGLAIHSDRFVRAHTALAGWFVGGLVNSARRVLGLRIVTECVPAGLRVRHALRGSASAAAPGDGDRPVLVFSRHAGAGDSFLLVDALINVHGRRPRIVLKEELRWDPCVDVALGRIPSRFVPAGHRSHTQVIESIAELADELTPQGALVLFPEGGNFTERRRTRAIERLRADGLDHLVQRAEELTHVLPPRPGGAFAAMDAAPGADVVFVAHSGLEQLSSPRQVWNGLPIRKEVQMAWWMVDASDVPSGHDERIEWLYAWWEHIDTWIQGHHPVEAPVGPIEASSATP